MDKANDIRNFRPAGLSPMRSCGTDRPTCETALLQAGQGMPPGCMGQAGRNRRGFILIVVLLIISLLAVILLEFSYESQVNFHMSRNCVLSQQALHCANAGIEVAISALAAHDEPHTGTVVERLLSGEVKISVGDGYCTISASRENGKININLLKDADGTIVRRRVDQMLRLIDIINNQYEDERPIGYGIVAAIIDWTDTDDNLTHLPFVVGENEGAEMDYYRRLATPRACKNAPLDMLEELLRIRGVVLKVFQGRQGNGESGISPITGLNQCMTVYGDGKIDINHAPVEVIQSLSERLTPGLAEAIIARRTQALFRDVKELQGIPGLGSEVYAEIHERITLAPNDRYYKIRATGVVGNFTREVHVILRYQKRSDRATRLLRREQ